MAKESVKRKGRVEEESPGFLALDPDKLGLLVAAFFAWIVMALSFYRKVGAFEALLRLTLTFVVSYTATFILVLVIRHFKEVELTPEEEDASAESEEGEDSEKGGGESAASPVPTDSEVLADSGVQMDAEIPADTAEPM